MRGRFPSWWRRSRRNCGQVLQAEAAGVDGHAEGGVDVHGEERLHVFESRDAAGSGDCVLRGGTEAAEPIEVRTLHHAFLIDIRAEEACAVGLERLQHRFGGEGNGLLPAFYDDASAFG